MKDATKGFRSVKQMSTDGGRAECKYKDICKKYQKKHDVILSVWCPYNCEEYDPKGGNAD